MLCSQVQLMQRHWWVACNLQSGSHSSSCRPGEASTVQASASPGCLKGVGNAIHQINRYLVNSMVCFVNPYPLDSHLYSGCFKQLGPGLS